MEHKLNTYFLTVPEPAKSALLFLRQFFINDMSLKENWKFNTPFYYFNGKWFCYISYHKKKDETYIGFVRGHKIKHDSLISGGRKQIKIYPINPAQDINIKELREIVLLHESVY